MVKRPLRSSYQPGSTFKIVTSLAAYRKGLFDPNRPAFCPGGYRLGQRLVRCLGHHGNITYERAMSKSCNTYFCDLGLRTGEVAINAAARELGLGAPVGIDIGGEARGIVPDWEWLTKTYKDPQWHGGDTLNLAIGQGMVSTTPLQMANLVAIVANDGVGYRPHLVRSFVEPLGGKTRRVLPELGHQVAATPAFWAEIKRALRGVVSEGTARSANLPGIAVAGKTGSAEHGRDTVTHAWFVGFAPVEKPKIAVCVLLEDAGHGGDVAAPIAAEVIRKYLAKR